MSLLSTSGLSHHSLLADLLDAKPSPYAEDMGAWAADKLGEELWSKQADITVSVRENRRTAVKSCHDVGKSHVASRTAAWWLDIYPPGEAFVVTTAPTFKQVRNILWRYIGRAHRKGNLPGHVNQTEWFIGDEIVAFGSKPADYDPAAFQGIHAKHVLVIIDEACGVPVELWTAAGALATNRFSRILAIGNPDDPTAHFAKVCQPGSGWNVLQISAKDSPNFTGESVSDRLKDELISQEYLDDLIADGCGPGTAIWSSKVEGEFPEDSEDGVIVASMLAKVRIPRENETTSEPIELGIDVGGSEDGDETVVRERIGVKAGRRWGKRSNQSEVIAQLILECIVETGATRVKIDSIGIGWGVAGHLRSMATDGKHSATITEVNVGSASRNPKRFPRLRDELWWEVGRMACEQGTWDLSEIDNKTAADLMAPRWSPDARGRIQIEPKAETKKRLGRSPDDADALLLAFYSPPTPRGARMHYQGRK